MPPKDERSERQKKFWYYLDEVLVFAIMFVAVLCKETVVALVSGSPVLTLGIRLPKIIGATLVTIIVYGSMNESFRYNDKDKPPLPKRLATACLQGLGWQSLFDIPGM